MQSQWRWKDNSIPYNCYDDAMVKYRVLKEPSALLGRVLFQKRRVHFRTLHILLETCHIFMEHTTFSKDTPHTFGTPCRLPRRDF